MFPGGSGGGLEPGGWAVRERECPLGLEKRHGQTAGSFRYFGAFGGQFTWLRSSLVAQKVKNPPANAGDIRDMASIPGSGRSLGGGHGNPLQNFAWEISWTEEPSGLQSMGSQRARHDWMTKQWQITWFNFEYNKVFTAHWAHVQILRLHPKISQDPSGSKPP